MNALVTGGTGFVGRHLVEALLRRGDTVTVLARSPKKARDLEERGVLVARGDLGDRPALRAAAAGQDVIFHLAGLVAARSDAEFLEVNRDGTGTLVAAALETGRPRLIYVSSLSASGPAARGTRLRGDEVPGPLTGYGRSKLAGEAAVTESGLPWTILRPPAVYGPYDTELLTVFRAARLGVVPIFGDGSQELSLIYVPDLAEALIAAARSPATLGRRFCVSHPEIVTSRNFVHAVATAVGRSVSVVPVPRLLAAGILRVTSAAAWLAGRPTLLNPDKAREFFAEAWTCDPAPFEASTGWRAACDLATGARETAAWYRSAGWL